MLMRAFHPSRWGSAHVLGDKGGWSLEPGRGAAHLQASSAEVRVLPAAAHQEQLRGSLQCPWVGAIQHQQPSAQAGQQAPLVGLVAGRLCLIVHAVRS